MKVRRRAKPLTAAEQELMRRTGVDPRSHGGKPREQFTHQPKMRGTRKPKDERPVLQNSHGDVIG